MALPPSVRIYDGDFTLTLAELRQAESEVVTALEILEADASPTHRRMLIELLVVARDLISRKTN